MHCLTSTLATAISTAESLTLTVIHQQGGLTAHTSTATGSSAFTTEPEHGVDTALELPSPPPPVMTCPAYFATVLGSVFARLPEAVPHLRTLRLAGCCYDAALYEFGAACPLLGTLCLEPVYVPIAAVQGMGYELPSLQKLVLSNQHLVTSQRGHLGAYMDSIFRAAQQCQTLSHLVIDLPAGAYLACRSSSWELLPLSIRKLECSCSVTPSEAYQAFITRLPSLHLLDPPCADLLELAHRFPRLRELTVTGDEPLQVVCPPFQDNSPQRTQLIEALLCGELKVYCTAMSIRGGGMHVHDMLNCLPTFGTVQSIKLVFTGNGDIPAKCLERFESSFPDLQTFTLADERGVFADAAGRVLDVQFFSPLIACTALQSLQLHAWLQLSTAGLLGLCDSLPQLKALGFVACKGVDKEQLVAGLQAMGREIDIMMNVRPWY
ncbi:MAG: hypothetical protein WDW38_007654 [Sanguina aurantia]